MALKYGAGDEMEHAQDQKNDADNLECNKFIFNLTKEIGEITDVSDENIIDLCIDKLNDLLNVNPACYKRCKDRVKELLRTLSVEEVLSFESLEKQSKYSLNPETESTINDEEEKVLVINNHIPTDDEVNDTTEPDQNIIEEDEVDVDADIDCDGDCDGDCECDIDIDIDDDEEDDDDDDDINEEEDVDESIENDEGIEPIATSRIDRSIEFQKNVDQVKSIEYPVSGISTFIPIDELDPCGPLYFHKKKFAMENHITPATYFEDDYLSNSNRSNITQATYETFEYLPDDSPKLDLGYDNDTFRQDKANFGGKTVEDEPILNKLPLEPTDDHNSAIIDIEETVIPSVFKGRNSILKDPHETGKTPRRMTVEFKNSSGTKQLATNSTSTPNSNIRKNRMIGNLQDDSLIFSSMHSDLSHDEEILPGKSDGERRRGTISLSDAINILKKLSKKSSSPRDYKKESQELYQFIEKQEPSEEVDKVRQLFGKTDYKELQLGERSSKSERSFDDMDSDDYEGERFMCCVKRARRKTSDIYLPSKEINKVYKDYKYS